VSHVMANDAVESARWVQSIRFTATVPV
jgi:hypothetical protein